MLTKQDLQSIREVMREEIREEIQVSVPLMIKSAIQEQVPNILKVEVPKIVREEVPKIVREINEKELIPAIVTELSSITDDLKSLEKRIVRLEVKTGLTN